MANVLVLQAIQGIDNINKCRYSILKYLEVYNLNPPSDIAIFLYTDQPAYFESFIPFFSQFGIKEVSMAQRKEWTGENGHNERVTMQILAEVSTHFHGNILFLQNNCYLIKPVETIFSDIEAGNYFVLSYLGELANDKSVQAQKLKKLLSDNNFQSNGNSLQTTDLKLFNPSVIGMNSASREVIEDIIELSDLIYKQYPHPIIESFTYSYCLQANKAKVKNCDGQVAYFKDERALLWLLRSFFNKNAEESIPNLVKALSKIDIETIWKMKLQFDSLPFYKKWINNFTGKGWNIKSYEKKI
jgi:hypothetical protein